MLAENEISFNSPNNSIFNTVFAVIDVETTGLSPDRSRITEIGIVKVKNGEIIGEYQQLVNPEQFIPYGITRLTGITNEMVQFKPKFEEIAGEVLEFIFSDGENVILGGHNVRFDYGFLNSSLIRAGYNRLVIASLCTARLARRLSRSLPSKSLSSLRRHFKIHSRRAHRALDDAKATAIIITNFIEQLVTDFEIETTDELLGFQYRKIYENKKLPARFKKLKVILRNAPQKPGVYYMLNRSGEIIYIGKAKNLKDRLSSYFYHNVSHTSKIKKLVRYVHKLEWETTGSELSALLLESKMIKLHKPMFNRALTSFRKYPFIKIDAQREYPRVQKVYEIMPDGAKYYGPFASSFTVNNLIEAINKNFKLRKCDDRVLHPAKGRTPCMYYEFSQCGAPCNYTVTAGEYKKEVRGVDRFLTGNYETNAVKLFEQQMHTEAENMNFEKASHLRDNIADLRKVLLNIELTNSIVEMQNYIIKCRDENSKNIGEIFLMAGGKLAKTYIVDSEDPDEDFYSNLYEEINYLYFSGTLFRDYIFSGAQQKFKINEIDQVKIISNWVYRNYKPSRILKLTPKTRIDDVMKFIFK
ncbi:MAG: GIY-YIG nuclease family protein [Chlorobi bacterium]|nr:GIY-YIG nuclease family protein [Chlorobiota bacterium]MCI0714780.1 GIY-YIG nuclease family protein [Chlorobiota bacterium]